MMTHWTEVEQMLREEAYGTLDDDPQILLETDGGPIGRKAELIYARLFGFDDEIVADGMRLYRVEPTLILPIMRPMRRWLGENSDPFEPPYRRAVYQLQSGYAGVRVAAEMLPPEIPLLQDHTAEVLYLRYRRRS